MKTKLPSNRSFGWTFAAIFALIGLFEPWSFAAAGTFAAVTLVRADWLAPLNRAWMKLGELLGRIVNPIVLGILYFGLFTPVGVVMRLAGRDALARRRELARRSYWVPRDPPGPAENSFNNMY